MLPGDPIPLVRQWLEDVAGPTGGGAAMTLATVNEHGRPSARMVICRGLDAEAGWLAFYGDRESPKGLALERTPWAALVFHWDALGRQVRVEGPVTLAPDADTEAYWRSRPRDARVAALATYQSRPIASRSLLLARVEAAGRDLGDEVPRPERWVGYRVWAERVELWVSQPARLHDRALWTRPLTTRGTGFTGGPWRASRLEP